MINYFNYENENINYIELVFSNKEYTKVIKIPEWGIKTLKVDIINKEKTNRKHFYKGNNFQLIYNPKIIESFNSKDKIETLLNNYSEYYLLGIDVHRKDKSFFSISISGNEMLSISQKNNISFIFSGEEKEYKTFIKNI